jgi:hypothetical protein
MLDVLKKVSMKEALNARLSTNIDDPTAIPYFLWDEPMNVSQLQTNLQAASRAERVRLLAKIMREA